MLTLPVPHVIIETIAKRLVQRGSHDSTAARASFETWTFAGTPRKPRSAFALGFHHPEPGVLCHGRPRAAEYGRNADSGRAERLPGMGGKDRPAAAPPEQPDGAGELPDGSSARRHAAGGRVRQRVSAGSQHFAELRNASRPAWRECPSKISLPDRRDLRGPKDQGSRERRPDPKCRP